MRRGLRLTLDATRLCSLGTFQAAAANEDGYVVEAVDFEYQDTTIDSVVPSAEIAELRWLDPCERPLSDDLAPLLAEQLIPWLHARSVDVRVELRGIARQT